MTVATRTPSNHWRPAVKGICFSLGYVCSHLHALAHITDMQKTDFRLRRDCSVSTMNWEIPLLSSNEQCATMINELLHKWIHQCGSKDVESHRRFHRCFRPCEKNRQRCRANPQETWDFQALFRPCYQTKRSAFGIPEP